VIDAGERRETDRSPVFELAGDVMFHAMPEGCGYLAEAVSGGCVVMMSLVALPLVPSLLR